MMDSSLPNIPKRSHFEHIFRLLPILSLSFHYIFMNFNSMQNKTTSLEIAIKLHAIKIEKIQTMVTARIKESKNLNFKNNNKRGKKAAKSQTK
jgi:hypothetical protein